MNQRNEIVNIRFNNVFDCLGEEDKGVLIEGLIESGLEREEALNIVQILTSGLNLGFDWHCLDAYDRDMRISKISHETMLKMDVVSSVLDDIESVLSMNKSDHFEFLSFEVVDDGSAIVYGMNDPKGEIRLPEKAFVNGRMCQISGVGREAFYNCTGLTSILIPNGITRIEDDAFAGCTELTSIVIPDGVTKVGKGTFFNCTGLTSIVIPEGISKIGESAFFGCMGLNSIVISEGVMEIGCCAISGCTELTSIVIPKEVTEIGEWAFHGCTNLKTVYCSSKSDYGHLFESCVEIIKIDDVKNNVPPQYST